jgi:septal ring-binding cell division protein DamX
LAEDAFPISGTIDPKAFPFLLMDLHRQGATGSLKVDGPAYQKALYFRGGRILFGSSNDPKDQLGSILIESGRISPEQLEDVNTKVGPGSPLAKVLAESGFVSQRELSEAARAKVERILSDVLSYDSGSFEFEDGVLPKGAVDLKLSTDKLVLAAIRRVGDRAFVLRHLGGLGTVISLAEDAEKRLAEVQAEVAHLPEQLDGRRSLKDAAAAARLDEFDAAKIACGLVLLGLARPADAAPEPPVESGFAIVEGDDLDLGTTARMAFSPAADAATSATAEIEPELDPRTFAPGPEVEPEAVTLASSRRYQPETVYIEPGAPAVLPEELALQPEAPPPAPPPPAAPPRRPTPADTNPPAAPREIRLPSMPEATLESAGNDVPVKASPPSREDLAALDALLNSRGLEGPMTPLEKPKEERWEPRFGQTTPRPLPPRGNGRLIAAAAAALVLVTAVGGGVWYRYLRGRAPVVPMAVIPKPIPTTTTTLVPVATPTPEALASPVALPVAAASAAPISTPTAAATPIPTSAPPSPPPAPSATTTHRSGSGSLADARTSLEKGDFTQAAREFASSLKSVGRGSYTVQLLVACAEETVAKASQNVSAQELFIVPVEYKGRSCYRICWGVYENETGAHAAVKSIPEYFRKGGASPKAVSTASVIP